MDADSIVAFKRELDQYLKKIIAELQRKGKGVRPMAYSWHTLTKPAFWFWILDVDICTGSLPALLLASAKKYHSSIIETRREKTNQQDLGDKGLRFSYNFNYKVCVDDFIIGLFASLPILGSVRQNMMIMQWQWRLIIKGQFYFLCVKTGVRNYLCCSSEILQVHQQDLRRNTVPSAFDLLRNIFWNTLKAVFRLKTLSLIASSKARQPCDLYIFKGSSLTIFLPAWEIPSLVKAHKSINLIFGCQNKR